MSWLKKLFETYEAVSSNEAIGKDLEPYFHKKEQCHIEIIIDGEGNFLRAENLLKEVRYGKQKFWKGEDTIIPITPKSLTGRTSGAAPYPLAEQIQYVAKDYPDFGGIKKSYFKEYITLLNSWADSKEYSHLKVRAVAKYVAKGSVIHDLLQAGILYAFEEKGETKLITKWAKQGPVEEDGKKKAKPALLHAVSAAEQGNAKIRWRIQKISDLNDATWGDQKLITNWISLQTQENKINGLCQILGKRSFVFDKHPKGIVPKANDAKLISAPTDKSYLTYQGRFTQYEQACTLSFEVSQKAHNALRWLIAHQGYKNNEQVYVAWAVSGEKIPPPLNEVTLFTSEIRYQPEAEEESAQQIDHTIDIGQYFANKLKKYIAGYSKKLEPNDQIVVLGLDSATTGRMGIIYYRKLLASEFLARLYDWHTHFAWPQRYTKELTEQKGKKKKVIWPENSPIPRVIAEAAYGDILKSNDTLKKSVLERILPCIVDGRPFPKDIMVSAVRRAGNRNNCEHWEWERNLGVACALFKGYYERHTTQHKRRNYKMALEKDRTERDYLYGRLLAVAEKIEEVALYVGGESRPTSAARLMQRFADRPFSTWLTIEKSLQPYMQRLQGNRAGFLTNRKKELDEIHAAFTTDDFTSDKSLTGEFLLGYHCQRMELRKKVEKEPAENNSKE